MLPKKALILGARGQLAGALRRGTPAGVEVVALERSQLDICDESSIRAALDHHQPDLVWNGAAFNAVDRAQSLEGARDAMQINALGPTLLAVACRDFGARLVHFSTDFVFDGYKASPYFEADATNPLSIYGASKLAGERAVLAVSPRHLAIRVQRLFGPLDEVSSGSGSVAKPGGNFPLLMLRLARERGKVRVVDDQIGTPTYNPDLARAAWQLVARAEGGLFHLSNAGETTFADYAETIFRMASVPCEVERISSRLYGAPAARPLYSTFSNAKAQSLGVEPLRSWDTALSEFLEHHV
ncbi:dTDP-4-dehydrorhamnose reductase [Abditibacteriota bacterium]|nr:dTDP-4-dehydrorhamnose reductase [Abditibacteriota bacterium]